MHSLSFPMKTGINPALRNLGVLVGAWTMELPNASFLPDPSSTIRGTMSFEWFEGGDLLIMRAKDNQGTLGEIDGRRDVGSRL